MLKITYPKVILAAFYNEKLFAYHSLNSYQVSYNISLKRAV